ncbi:MAG: biosynthetic-type acetolactate synthase large subunit [Bacteroidetes bacterium]|nr:biosynthetic-type acetolactate synthase large subunit [Bacteroidota bacterium]
MGTSTKINGARAVILSLLAEHTDILFGYPGGAIMPVYDALYDYNDRITHILVRHEQGAIHAAEGYARANGKTGVCLATSGPGATNLVTGLADAQIDSTPLVCITGQVASPLLGTDAFQETDIISITSPVTKWNCQVTRAADIPSVLAKAFYIAQSGRPGPVLVDITKDAQFELFDFEYEKCTGIRSYTASLPAKDTDLQQAAALINEAKRPYILAGQGVLLSGARNELKLLSEKTGSPVACTLLGLGAMPADHPLYVGYLGMHGNYGPNVLTNECDLIIAVGMRFDDRVTGNVKTYARQAKVIHIDIDPAEINKIIKADVAIVADAREALMKLLPLVKHQAHPEWLSEFERCKNLEQKTVIDSAISGDGNELKMAEVIHLLAKKTGGRAIVVTDVGQHQMICSRYYTLNDGGQLITSGGLGTMGYGLPAAMGAKLAVPQKEVIAVLGDGGFQMTLQELAVIRQYQIPVKVLLLNNNYLGMVRQWQELFFEKRYSFTEMSNPDFMLICKGYGLKTNKINQRAQLDEALNKMLRAKEPYFLEVTVMQEENVFPMVPGGAGVADVKLK